MSGTVDRKDLLRRCCRSLGQTCVVITLLAVLPLPAQAQSELGPPSSDSTMSPSDPTMSPSDPSMSPSSDYGSSGYGAGESYGGGGLETPVSSLIPVVSDGIFRTFSELDLRAFSVSPNSAPLPSGPILLGQAGDALGSGYQTLALDLLFGHMISETEDAGPAYAAVRYSPLLKRPLWQVRWGVSVAVRLDGVTDPKPLTGANRAAAGGFESSPDPSMQSPPGSDPMMNDTRGDRIGGSGGVAVALPGGSMAGINVNEILERNLGLVATSVAEEFSKRQQNGAFGQGLLLVRPSAPQVAPPPNAQAFAGSSPGSEYDSSMMSPTSDSSSMDPSMMDPSMMGMDPRGAGVRQEEPLLLPSAQPMTPPSDALPMWIPGCLFVGETPSADAIAQAKAAGVELLLHFDVLARAGRGTDVQNVTICRVFHVGTGKVLVSSKKIDSLEAAQLARGGRSNDNDYIRDQLNTMWSVIDRQATVVQMPKITPEIAKKRVGMIIAAPPKNRLLTLAEIRMYEAEGLLEPSDVALAFDLVGGDEAMEILYGPTETRREIVRKWATDSE